MKFVIRLIIAILLCTFRDDDLPGQDYSPKLSNICYGTDIVNLIHPQLVSKFYELNQQKPFWFSENEQFLSLRLSPKDIVDSAGNMGLDKNKCHYNELLNYTADNLQPANRSLP